LLDDVVLQTRRQRNALLGCARWALQHMHPDRYARRPLTMGINDVKDLIQQVMHAIAARIKDPPTRAAVRRAIRSLVGDAVRKCKEQQRPKTRLKLNTQRPAPNWPLGPPIHPNRP
jgi:hypothetical protein